MNKDIFPDYDEMFPFGKLDIFRFLMILFVIVVSVGTCLGGETDEQNEEFDREYKVKFRVIKVIKTK